MADSDTCPNVASGDLTPRIASPGGNVGVSRRERLRNGPDDGERRLRGDDAGRRGPGPRIRAVRGLRSDRAFRGARLLRRAARALRPHCVRGFERVPRHARRAERGRGAWRPGRAVGEVSGLPPRRYGVSSPHLGSRRQPLALPSRPAPRRCGRNDRGRALLFGHGVDDAALVEAGPARAVDSERSPPRPGRARPERPAPHGVDLGRLRRSDPVRDVPDLPGEPVRRALAAARS